MPLATPLRLRVEPAPDGCRLELFDDHTVLVSGGVTGVPPSARSSQPPAIRPRPRPSRRDAAAHLGGCFACGLDNPLGLAVSLRADATTVGGTWMPRPGFRLADGTLAPVALTTLLDEAAFWLGALATGESGMTTELRVTLHTSAVAEGPITVSGLRSAVQARPADARYWDTAVAARDAAGASWPAPPSRSWPSGGGASAGHRHARRQHADVLRHVFPAYVR